MPKRPPATGRRTWLPLVGVLLAGASVMGCSGGMLDPSSPRASTVVTLWWVMFVISAVVTVLVTVLLVWGLVRARSLSAVPRTGSEARDRWFVGAGGIALPVVVMVFLMVLTVWSSKAITEGAEDDALRIEVVGHQWWWEIRYPDDGFTTANEIHIPTGEAVQLELTSEDVIHSFWVPELGGKIDLIPDRTNSYVIEASESGTYHGQCAEFCGLQHAGMRILVVAHDREGFDEWVAGQQQPATRIAPEDGMLFEGQQAFLGSSCVYCHTIEGTNASGTLGPDLTHLASRQRLAANIIPNSRGHLAGWILNPQSIKPGTLMPPTQLSADQLDALLDYLGSLE